MITYTYAFCECGFSLGSLDRRAVAAACPLCLSPIRLCCPECGQPVLGEECPLCRPLTAEGPPTADLPSGLAERA